MPTAPTKALFVKFLGGMERSQGWLARELRVSRQMVSAWARRQERCPKARQAQIALILGIRASEYFDEDGYAR